LSQSANHLTAFIISKQLSIQVQDTKVGLQKLTLKTVGSFISFHIPSTPLEMNSFTNFAHHDRVFSCVKSGKTQGPGHTSPASSNRR